MVRSSRGWVWYFSATAGGGATGPSGPERWRETNCPRRVLSAMRFFLSVVLLAAALRADELRPATPDEILLFKEALKNSQQDPEHWAYTETTSQKIGIGKT